MSEETQSKPHHPLILEHQLRISAPISAPSWRRNRINGSGSLVLSWPAASWPVPSWPTPFWLEVPASGTQACNDAGGGLDRSGGECQPSSGARRVLRREDPSTPAFASRWPCLT